MKCPLFGRTAVMGVSALLFAVAGSIPVNAQQKPTEPYIPNDHRPLQLHSAKQHSSKPHALALKSKTMTKTALICPVTGDKIASVKAAVGHSSYKGKTYYFCCAGCKPRFDKNPAKFVKNAAAGKYEKM